MEFTPLHQGKLAIAADEFTALYLLPVPSQFRRCIPWCESGSDHSLGSHIPDDVLQHNSELGF